MVASGVPDQLGSGSLPGEQHLSAARAPVLAPEEVDPSPREKTLRGHQLKIEPRC